MYTTCSFYECLLGLFLYFEFGALQFHRMLSRWVASGPPVPERLNPNVFPLSKHCSQNQRKFDGENILKKQITLIALIRDAFCMVQQFVMY